METSDAMVADIASCIAERPSATGSFIGMFQHVSLLWLFACLLPLLINLGVKNLVGYIWLQ